MTTSHSESHEQSPTATRSNPSPTEHAAPTAEAPPTAPCPAARQASKSPASSRPVGAPTRHRILLVDDHPVVSRGLTELLDHEPDLKVCATADRPEAALQLIRDQRPDLVLLDLSLQERSGLDLLRDLRGEFPFLRILVLSLHDELIYAPRALRLGAVGYVMKDESTETLLRAIRKVLGGGVHLSPRLEANVREQLMRGHAAVHPLETLSDRELEVLRLIGRGMANCDIARLLGIRLKTVESHRTHIKEKLQLKGASELVRFAIEHSDAG